MSLPPPELLVQLGRHLTFDRGSSCLFLRPVCEKKEKLSPICMFFAAFSFVWYVMSDLNWPVVFVFYDVLRGLSPGLLVYFPRVFMCTSQSLAKQLGHNCEIKTCLNQTTAELILIATILRFGHN